MNKTLVQKSQKKWSQVFIDQYGNQTTSEFQKQHIFAVKNQELSESHWTFVLGDQVDGLVRDNRYDIRYLGLHRHTFPLTSNSTKDHKETRKKFEEFLQKQKVDIAEGVRVEKERIGIFEDSESPIDSSKE